MQFLVTFFLYASMLAMAGYGVNVQSVFGYILGVTGFMATTMWFTTDALLAEESAFKCFLYVVMMGVMIVGAVMFGIHYF